MYRKLKLGPGTVVDVCANLGFFSLLFAKMYPQCFVEAVEPNPYAAERMSQNLAASKRLGRRIVLHQCGGRSQWGR